MVQCLVEVIGRYFAFEAQEMKEFHQFECRAGLRFEHRCWIPVYAQQLLVDVDFGHAGQWTTPAEVHIDQVDAIGMENDEILVDIATKNTVRARLMVLAELHAQSNIAQPRRLEVCTVPLLKAMRM